MEALLLISKASNQKISTEIKENFLSNKQTKSGICEFSRCWKLLEVFCQKQFARSLKSSALRISVDQHL